MQNLLEAYHWTSFIAAAQYDMTMHSQGSGPYTQQNGTVHATLPELYRGLVAELVPQLHTLQDTHFAASWYHMVSLYWLCVYVCGVLVLFAFC